MTLTLTTEALVKTYLSIPTETTIAKLAAIVSAANDYVNSRVPLGSTSYSETYEGHGGRALILRNRPVIAVSAVEIDGESVSAFDSATLIGYRLQGNVCYLHGGLTYLLGSLVEIDYTAGIASAPNILIHAATEIAASWYAKSSRIDETTKSVGGQEIISYSTLPIPSTARTLIDTYVIAL
jgi:hypothetical protein